MPELPEVEGFRAFVHRHVVGRRVVRARALDDWMLKELSPRAFARRLAGRSFSGTERRGKLLIAFTAPRAGERDAPALVLHFGMTGRPLMESPRTPVHRWDRVVIDLEDGWQFRYRNMRRLGSVRLPTRTELASLLWSLGPDPLEAPQAWFREALAARRAPVKAVLLDQSFLAGIGNLYADESLFAARIRPDRPGSAVSREEARSLHASLRRLLRRAVADNTERLMAPMRLRVPRVAGAPCTACGTLVERATIGGRSSYFCPRCQR